MVRVRTGMGDQKLYTGCSSGGYSTSSCSTPCDAMQHNQDPASQSFLGPHTGLVCCGYLSENWPSMQCLVGEEAIVQEKEGLQACLLRKIRNAEAAHAVHHDK